MEIVKRTECYRRGSRQVWELTQGKMYRRRLDAKGVRRERATES